MHRLSNIIIRAIFFTAVSLLLAGSLYAKEDCTLRSISRSSSPSSITLILNFSKLPKHKSSGLSGQRLDLVLPEIEISPKISLPREDGLLVKTSISQKKETKILSFIFRSAPKRYEIISLKEKKQFKIIASWESVKPPRLVFNTDFSIEKSQYAGQWKSFFDKHESALSFSFPETFLTAQFYQIFTMPAAKLVKNKYLRLAAKHSAQNNWGQVKNFVAKAKNFLLSPRDMVIAEIFSGEAELYLGNTFKGIQKIEAAHALAEQHSMQKLWEDTFPLYDTVIKEPNLLLAQKKIKETLPMAKSYSLKKTLLVQKAAIMVAIGKPKIAIEILEGAGKKLPKHLKPITSLIKANALFDLGLNEKALALYKKTPWLTKAINKDIPSRSRLAECLYLAREYNKAIPIFQSLADTLPADNRQVSNFVFRLGRMYERLGHTDQSRVLFIQIADHYQGTEAENRADILHADNLILGNVPNYNDSSMAEIYGQVAQESGSPIIREEAAFKQALAFFYQGEKTKSIQKFSTFIKNFWGGNLKKEAYSFLGENLPGVIHELLKEEKDLEALTLVEAHRKLLTNLSLEKDFLMEMGKGFRRLGLHGKAIKLYRFFIDHFDGKREAAHFYLPLIESSYTSNDFSGAAQYAEKYLERFPKGGTKRTIFTFLIKSLAQNGEFEKAARFLTAPDAPEIRELDLWAGQIFSQVKDFRRAEPNFKRHFNRQKKQDRKPGEIFAYAETLFELGKNKEAAQLFQILFSHKDFYAPAMYRCGQIQQRLNNHAEAINFFKKLSEKTNNDYWKKLAIDSLSPLHE